MRKKIYPLYFSLGALVLYTLFTGIPSVLGLWYSFTDWNRFSRDINFVGWENFRAVFSSTDNYLTYIKNTFIFTSITIIFKTVIALFLALALHKGVTLFKNVYRALIFLPAILPVVVVGITFKSILNPRSGLLNEFLRDVGLASLAQQWLVNPSIALLSVVGVDTWKGVGYIMVILLAGLQAIPDELYEASDLDGAGYWQRLWHITLPMLRPAVVITTVLNLLHGLRVFDIVYVLTNGGPGRATEVVYTSILKEFSLGRYGVGTALTSLLMILMVFSGYFVIRLMERK